MFYGYAKIENDSLVTHRDSYRIANLSVVSVRKPFLVPGIAVGVCLAGFGASFFDLLYPVEILTVFGTALLCIAAGMTVAQLRLLSRDLAGASELGEAIWGTASSLHRIRSEIVRKLSEFDQKAAP